MAKSVRISLANKCQLLFGAAVLLILVAALSVGWLRMRTLVQEGREETARKLANAWLTGRIELGGSLVDVESLVRSEAPPAELTLTLIEAEEFELVAQRDPFLDKAIRRFQARSDRHEATEQARDDDGREYLRFARAIRKSDLASLRGGSSAFRAGLDTTATADPVEMVLLLHLRSDLAARQLMLNRIYIVAAGLLAGLLAIGVFWFITTRIILSPVRLLRSYAAKVSEGDLNIRSDINTGDEFEQLSDMFNTMLDRLKANQDELRKVNKSLDLKLGELAETNVALYEANKIKGEFLANVSHELRTPLNSIVGFAEVLQETLAERTGPVDEKRKRYAANIITSSRRLLDLINDLLDLAKIEAGRMDLRISPVSVADTCEGLASLMKPQAQKRRIDLQLELQPNIPLVQTDASRLQQILFNFLSNAVKFTPEGGTVTMIARQMAAEERDEEGRQGVPRVRISVSDTGPGIPEEDHERIFDKFTQLDPSVTKVHGGTGLGLTISRDLSRLLQGHIELDSAPGRGATFSLILPMVMEARSAPLMPQEEVVES